MTSKYMYLVRQVIGFNRKIRVWYLKKFRILFLGIKLSLRNKRHDVPNMDYQRNENKISTDLIPNPNLLSLSSPAP